MNYIWKTTVTALTVTLSGVLPSKVKAQDGGKDAYYANVESVLNVRPMANTLCPPIAEVSRDIPLEVVRYSSQNMNDPNRWALVVMVFKDAEGNNIRHEGWVKASFLVTEDEITEATTTCQSENCAENLNPPKLSRLLPAQECKLTGLVDHFYNSNGCWRQTVNEAEICTAKGWQRLSAVERAEHMRRSYQALFRAHGFRNRPYNAEQLTCIAYHESTFNPQMQNTQGANAFGLGQVMRGTANEIFDTNRRFNWFDGSKVQGFNTVTRGEDFIQKMRTSPLAQMELSLLALELKRREAGDSESSSLIIGNYRGSTSEENQKYAAHIRECASCINAGAGRVSQGCLDKAKY